MYVWTVQSRSRLSTSVQIKSQWFRLVFNCDLNSVSRRFRDVTLRSLNLPPSLVWAQIKGFPSNFFIKHNTHDTALCMLFSEYRVIVASVVLSQYPRVSYDDSRRRTDDDRQDVMTLTEICSAMQRSSKQYCVSLSLAPAPILLCNAKHSWCMYYDVYRRRLRLRATKSLYLIVNNRSLVSNGTLLCEVYERDKDDDGFLYMIYASQETFG